LKPGESKTVTFHLNTRDLAFVNHQLKYVVEEGKFVASVADLTVPFSVKATQTFDR
jgi:beta-glucosidase